MRAIVVKDQTPGPAGVSLAEVPSPHAAENDAVVQVHAASFTRGEVDWPSTRVDRAGRDRTPSVLGHEVSGVVVGLGYGTTGLTIGQRVFGLTDWARNGTLAEQVAVEARNLAPLPAQVDHVTAAAAAMGGITAWQALFDHAHLAAGQAVLIHGAAGAVGSIAVQLALAAGAQVIGTGRARDREFVGELGAHAFVDIDEEPLENVAAVDVVLDMIGGDVLRRSAGLVRAGGTLVSVAEPPTVRPTDGRAIFFVVEPNRAQFAALAQRLVDGSVRPRIGDVLTLDEAADPIGADARRSPGKTIVRVTEGE